MSDARASSPSHRRLVAPLLCGAILLSTGCLTTLDLDEEFPDPSDDMNASRDLATVLDALKDDMPAPPPRDMEREDMKTRDAASDLDMRPDLPVTEDMPADLMVDMPVEDMPPVDMAPLLPGQGLIFSEVVEGTTGKNKLVEIYNAANIPVNLASLLFITISQGPDLNTARTLPLDVGQVKTLNPGEVIILCNPDVTDFDLTRCAIKNDPVINFNGDDIIAIYYDADGDQKITSPGDRIIDSFGQVNNAPPSTKIWENATFRRCNPAPYLSDKLFMYTDYYTRTAPEVFDDLGVPPASFSCR